MKNFLRRLALLAASFSYLLLPMPLFAGGDGFSVISHRYALEIKPAERSFSCTDTMEMRSADEQSDEVTFFLHPVFVIGGIRLNGELFDGQRRREGISVTGLSRGQTNIVIITYGGDFSVLSEFSRIADSSALLRTEELLPRTTENLELVRGSITVPSNWKAIAAGIQIGEETLGDRTTFVWELDGRVTTVGWICAGRYILNEFSHQKTRLASYLVDGDSSRATAILSLAADVLAFCSGRFTQYRFPALNIVEVDDWVGGGNVLAASSPSMIIVKKHPFRSEDSFNRVETILPHEIAHQWWPLTVFVDPMDLAFLSEGLCEYTALMYGETSGTLTVRDSPGTHQLLRSLVTRAARGKDLPLQQERDLRTLPSHYLKAAYVHNMLRRIVGEGVYDTLLHELAVRFQAKKTGLGEFSALTHELSGRNMDWFFDQWVKKSGIPKLKLYNVKSVRGDSVWVTRGRVRVIGYEKFTTFIEVSARTPDGEATSRLWLGEDSLGVYKNDVPFSIVTKTKPQGVRLDPSGDVLKMQRMPPKFSDLREPGEGIVIVGTGKNSTSLLERARRDSATMAAGGWSCRIKPDTAITLVDLQNDRVLFYGIPSENSVIRTYAASFPMRFVGDSVIVDAEPIYDGSLTLLQAIDSPFSPQGIWCWIAPLSAAADDALQPHDASWILAKGTEILSSGTWKVRDEDLEIILP